jgi:hypothetical protein
LSTTEIDEEVEVARRSNEELIAFADEHLLYEISMVAALVDRFVRLRELLAEEQPPEDKYAAEVFDWAGRNADIETFAVHVRVLIDFFFGGGSPVAADYFDDKSTWPSTLRPKSKLRSLQHIKRRVGAEISHLSHQRTAPAADWGYQEIWNNLAPLVLLFIENASADRLSRECVAAIKALIPPSPRANHIDLTPPGTRLAVGATTAPPYLVPEDPTPNWGTAVVPPPTLGPGSSF